MHSNKHFKHETVKVFLNLKKESGSNWYLGRGRNRRIKIFNIFKNVRNTKKKEEKLTFLRKASFDKFDFDCKFKKNYNNYVKYLPDVYIRIVYTLYNFKVISAIFKLTVGDFYFY